MEKIAYKSLFLNEKDYWWCRGMRALMSHFLRKYITGKNNQILDAGCGTGGNFEMLRQFGRLHGIDVSEDALNFSRKKAAEDEPVLYGAVEKIPFEDSHFGVIHCSDVLYHQTVENDNGAMREFARVLKPDGFLFIREAAFSFLYGWNDRVVWVKRRYTKKQLTEKLEASGFRVLEARYVNFFLFLPIMAVRILENILNRNSVTQEMYRPSPLNRIFQYCLDLEVRLLPYVSFPFGTSIICVAQLKKSI